jgi:hypothetical protein
MAVLKFAAEKSELEFRTEKNHYSQAPTLDSEFPRWSSSLQLASEAVRWQAEPFGLSRREDAGSFAEYATQRN